MNSRSIIYLTSVVTMLSSVNVNANLLGLGYDKSTGKSRARCVYFNNENNDKENKNIIKVGEPSSNLTVKFDISRQHLDKFFNLGGGGELALEGVSGSASADFTSEVMTNDLRMNLTYLYDITGPTYSYLPTKSTNVEHEYALSDIGSRVFGIGTDDAKKQVEIKNACGDSFVSQVRTGAKLAVSAILTFKTQDAKSKFAGAGHLSVADMFEASASFDMKNEKFKENVHITVTALQIGGDVRKLSKLFTSSGDKFEVPFIRCSFTKEGMDQCRKAFLNIVKYGDNAFKNGLNGMDYDETSPLGPAITGYSLQSYKRGGFDFFYESPALEEIANDSIKRQIVGKYRKSTSLLSLVDDYLSFTGLSNEDYKRLSDSRKILTNNIYLLNETRRRCNLRAICCNESYREAMGEEVDHHESLGCAFRLVKGEMPYTNVDVENFDIKNNFIKKCQIVALDNSDNEYHTIKKIAEVTDLTNELFVTDDKGQIKLDKNKRGVVKHQMCAPIFSLIKNKGYLDLSHSFKFDVKKEFLDSCKDVAEDNSSHLYHFVKKAAEDTENTINLFGNAKLVGNNRATIVKGKCTAVASQIIDVINKNEYPGYKDSKNVVLTMSDIKSDHITNIKDFDKGKITSLRSLIGFEKLREVNLANNKIKILSPLKKLERLEGLNIRNNDVKELPRLLKLEYLDASYNRFRYARRILGYKKNEEGKVYKYKKNNLVRVDGEYKMRAKDLVKLVSGFEKDYKIDPTGKLVSNVIRSCNKYNSYNGYTEKHHKMLDCDVNPNYSSLVIKEERDAAKIKIESLIKDMRFRDVY